MSTVAKRGLAPRESRKAVPPSLTLLLWLAPTLVLLSLVWISTFWHLPTRIQLDLETTRLAFTLGGEERREILNFSVNFSSLVIEDCGTAVFAAENMEVADPRQLVPAAETSETSYFPAAAWRMVKPTDPVKLSCLDPASKLTLKHPDPAARRLGSLDRIRFAPGSQVILTISPVPEPALSLEIETPQDLSLALGRNVEFVTDLIKPEGIAIPFSGDLLTWRAKLPDARRMLEITSGEHGLVLIVTPTPGQASEFFRKPLDLPLASVELLEEDLEGTLQTPLRDKATLSYPEYPDIPAVTIEKDESVGLRGLLQAQLRNLEFDAEKGALRVRFDGIAERAFTRGTVTTDRRLTVSDTFRYSSRWKLIAVVAAWLVPTTWAAFGAWKNRRAIGAFAGTIVARESEPSRIELTHKEEKLRILFLASDPQAIPRLDLTEELRVLESELRGVRFRDRIVLTTGLAIRPDDLVHLLRRDLPTVVHFSGHGSHEGIVLRTDSGHITVSGNILSRLFRDRNIRLVVLNSCFSDNQAVALKDVVKAVVGTTAAVDDEAARLFTTAFYRTLGGGHDIKSALRDGGDAVAAHNLVDVFGAYGDLGQTLIKLE